MHNTQLIVDRIKTALLNKGTTQTKMLNDLQFSTGLITQWKSGLQNPKLDKLTAISEYLDVSLEYLLGNEQQQIPVIDDEAWNYLQELYTEKIMNKTGKKVTKQDIEETIKFLEFRTTNYDE